MAINVGDAIVYLNADLKGFQKAWSQAGREMRKNLGGIVSAINGAGRGIKSVGDTMTRGAVTVAKWGAGLGLAAGGAAVAVVKMQADFETAFSGVKKTVDASEEDFKRLEKGLIDMSKRIPQSASSLAGIMEVAGQMGIRGVDNLLSFTETMAMLADTTNIVGEEGALQLSRFMGVMRVSTGDVGKLGSALVDLGNQFAVRENEILETAQGMAGFGSQVGLTAQQVLALSATIRASGGQSQAAATAFQKLGLTMKDAVLTGSDELAVFAKTAGMTVEEFKQQFKTDAMGAIVAFVGGLKQINEAGESTSAVLAQLGLADQRLIREVGLVSANYDMLQQTLTVSSQAFDKNTALIEEARKKYGTLGAQLRLFWQNIQAPILRLSSVVLPKLTAMLTGTLIPAVQRLADRLVSHSKEIEVAVGKAVDWVVAKFTALVAWFQEPKNIEMIKEWVAKIISFAKEWGVFLAKVEVGALVFGPLLSIIGSLLISLAALLAIGGKTLAFFKLIPGVIAKISPLFSWFVTFLGWITTALSTAWSWIAGFFSWLTAGTAGVVAAIVGITAAAAAFIQMFVSGEWTKNFITELIDNYLPALGKAIDWAMDGVVKLVNGIGAAWGWIWEKGKDMFFAIPSMVAVALATVADAVLWPFEVAWDAIKTAFGSGWDWLKGWFGKIPGMAKSAFVGLKDVLLAPFKSAFGILTGVVNGLVDLINKIKIDVPDWVPGIGGKKFGFEIQRLAIPAFATGGIMGRTGLALVGEMGPELVRLPGGSRVYSNQASMAMAGAGGMTLNVNMPGMVIREMADVDRLSEAFYRKAKSAMMMRGMNR